MTDQELQARVRRYYEGRLREHGATAQGVDWKSEASQLLRFRQLERLWEEDPEAALIDYGCGYGALGEYIRARGHRGPYTGFDISPEMADAAIRHSGHLSDCQWTSDRSQLRPADYAVASGILNVKLDATEEDWHAYVGRTIADLASLGTRGFGFNALTAYSDPGKKRPDLYYADPLELFDCCRRTYGRFVALVHDYPLYEFTILVRFAT
jgi:SAM-dependent methyltransferase